MTLRFCDSFDHYTTAQILRKWTGEIYAANITVQSGAARTGSALFFNGSNQALWKTLSAGTTWFVGMAVRVATGNTGSILAFFDSTAGNPQVNLYLNAAGTISACRGASNLNVLGTTAVALPNQSWAYLEAKVVIDPSAGAVEIRLNGVDILNLTGVNTRATANTSADTIVLGADNIIGIAGRSYPWQWFADDFVVLDSAGSVNNTFLGDVTVQCVLPNGAGSNAQWTPVGAVANWQCVSENPADDDSTYVKSSALNFLDSYAHAAASGSTIYGVQLCSTARKDDSGPRSFAQVIVSGATTSLGATQALGTGYQMFTDIWEVDPNTSAQWTLPNLNAAEIGEKLIV